MAETRYLVHGKPPLHPGQILIGVLLPNYGLKLGEVAKRAELPAVELEKIANGKSGITVDIVNHLRPIFGKAAESLLTGQFVYDFFKEHGRRPNVKELRQNARLRPAPQ